MNLNLVLNYRFILNNMGKWIDNTNKVIQLERNFTLLNNFQ